jgi:hypothetical protein
LESQERRSAGGKKHYKKLKAKRSWTHPPSLALSYGSFVIHLVSLSLSYLSTCCIISHISS